MVKESTGLGGGEILRWLMRATEVAIFLGIFGMIQPWIPGLFKPGFQVLLGATIAYIILSHISPRR